jgi:hypothetical protein
VSPSDLDQEIRERIFAALDSAAAAVSSEEVVALAAGASSDTRFDFRLEENRSPWSVEAKRSRRLLAGVLSAVLIAASLVAIEIVGHSRGSSRQSIAAGDLDRTVLVDTSAQASTGGSIIPDIINAGSGARLGVPRLPDNYWDFPFSETVTGGYVVAVGSPASLAVRDDAEVLAFRIGSTTTIQLGLATYVYAGARPGTVWLLQELKLDRPQHGLAGNCTIRLASVSGALLVAATPLSCSTHVISAVPAGLIIQSAAKGGPLEIWNPATGRVLRVQDGEKPYAPAASAVNLVFEKWTLFHSGTAQFEVTNASTGLSRTIEVSAPAGMSLDSRELAVSPNGDFVAVIAVPAEFAKAHEQPSTGPERPIDYSHPPLQEGHLLVFRTSNGQVVLDRPVRFFSGLSWSADGSYVLLTLSASTLEAVPAWSVSASERTVTFPVSGQPDNGCALNCPGESYLVAGQPLG